MSRSRRETCEGSEGGHRQGLDAVSLGLDNGGSPSRMLPTCDPAKYSSRLHPLGSLSVAGGCRACGMGRSGDGAHQSSDRGAPEGFGSKLARATKAAAREAMQKPPHLAARRENRISWHWLRVDTRRPRPTLTQSPVGDTERCTREVNPRGRRHGGSSPEPEGGAACRVSESALGFVAAKEGELRLHCPSSSPRTSSASACRTEHIESPLETRTYLPPEDRPRRTALPRPPPTAGLACELQPSRWWELSPAHTNFPRPAGVAASWSPVSRIEPWHALGGQPPSPSGYSEQAASIGDEATDEESLRSALTPPALPLSRSGGSRSSLVSVALTPRGGDGPDPAHGSVPVAPGRGRGQGMLFSSPGSWSEPWSGEDTARRPRSPTTRSPTPLLGGQAGPSQVDSPRSVGVGGFSSPITRPRGWYDVGGQSSSPGGDCDEAGSAAGEATDAESPCWISTPRALSLRRTSSSYSSVVPVVFSPREDGRGQPARGEVGEPTGRRRTITTSQLFITSPGFWVEARSGEQSAAGGDHPPSTALRPQSWTTRSSSSSSSSTLSPPSADVSVVLTPSEDPARGLSEALQKVAKAIWDLLRFCRPPDPRQD